MLENILKPFGDMSKYDHNEAGYPSEPHEPPDYHFTRPSSRSE
jgi:hypothetical protein